MIRYALITSIRAPYMYCLTPNLSHVFKELLSFICLLIFCNIATQSKALA